MSLVHRPSYTAPQVAPPEGGDAAVVVLDEVRLLFSRAMSSEAFTVFSRARGVVGWERLTAAVAEGIAARYPNAAAEGRASTL
jgi:hypothetical protein